MTMYHDDINVMTDKGVMSGSLVFKIDDGELYCKYSYSDDSENMCRVKKKDNNSHMESEKQLKNEIKNWLVNGEKPRDENDNVIPFTY